MGHLERERIIVLKTLPYSESDLIVHGLNDKGIKKHFIAKKALNSKKRFSGGVLEATSFIEVEYKPSRSLHRLQEAWFLNDFKGLRKDYDRLQMALYFVKTISEISQEGSTDCKELFDLLGNALHLTEITNSLALLKLFFQIKLLFIQGVLPQTSLYSKILNCTLKDHLNFELDPEDFQALSYKMDQTLEHYLNF